MTSLTRSDMARRIFVALDVPDIDLAQAAIRKLGDRVGGFKVGLELCASGGWSGFQSSLRTEATIFADAKLHDIPKTVGKAAAVIAGHSCYRYFNVHASGGEKMIAAAREMSEKAAGIEGHERPKLLAVTLLTSLDESDLLKQGLSCTCATQVIRLGRLAMNAGADGLVCSGREIVPLRDALGEKPILMVPGIQMPETVANDQKRTMTPHDALVLGANYIVIGRYIMDRPNSERGAALDRVVDNILDITG